MEILENTIYPANYQIPSQVQGGTYPIAHTIISLADDNSTTWLEDDWDKTKFYYIADQ